MKNINEKKISPTFDEPKTGHGMEFNDNFNKTMTKNNLNIRALDEKLDSNKLTKKKKIFSLPKMEALVHSDPKLSALYNEMSEEGSLRWGYHYNELIMNMLFNDYVLTSPKYLQKYKQAIPVKKKRRDKSGIDQLKKQGEETEKRTKELEKEREKKKKKEVNESTPAASAGSFNTKAGETGNYESNTITTPKEWQELIRAEISQIAKEKTFNKNKKGSKNPTDSTNYVGGSSAKPSWDGGKIVKNPNNILNESDMNDLESIKTKAKETSKKEGVAQHVNQVGDNKYKISDFYDSDSTVVSYENGRELNEQGIEETTSASGAAGAGSSYVGYAGPSAWGSGELADKGKKTKKDKESFWDGGKLVKESNYITDPKGFEKFYNQLNEEYEQGGMITTPEQYKQFVQQLKSQGRKVKNEDVKRLAGEALYDLAVRLANRVLPMSWDDLPDVNSMWDYIDENGGMTLYELAEAAKEAANDRLAEEGMSLDDLMETNDKKGIMEKAKSSSQQQAAGMALAAKRGEMDVEDLKGAAKDMYDSMSEDELEDFAETKHEGLPKHVKEGGKVNEHHLETRDDKLDFIVKAMNKMVPGLFDPKVQREIWGELPDDKLHLFYLTTEKQLEKAGINPMAIGEGDIQESHLNTTDDKIEYLSKALTLLSNNKFNFSVDELNKMAAVMGGDLIDDLYDQAEKLLKDNMIDPVTLTSMNEESTENDLIPFEIPQWAASALINADESGLEDEDISKLNRFVNNVKNKYGNAHFMLGDIDGEDDLGFQPSNDIDNLGDDVYRLYIQPSKSTNEESMIDDNESSMKIKPPINTGSNSMPSGMDSGGPMSENKTNIMEKELEKIEKELKLFEMHHKKLQEDRKPATLVMKDRLGSENDKNFKKDLSHSGTKEIIDISKDLQYQDEQTTIEDPQKLSQDIEKQVEKNTKGESFKNVGNSTNNEGDEIPKRNHTDKESETVDMIRQGLGDYIYDNEPDERFEERMKRDMGDELYKKRQERMKFKADAPMYNKDSQPVDDGIEKVQFDKQKSGWNERYGIKESSITGKYKDDLNKSRLVDFKLNEVKEVKSIKENWKALSFVGLGNTYDSKTNVNESVKNAIEEYKFYIDENKSVFVTKESKMLSESDNKKGKTAVNEQFDKMKHLLGYNPKDYTNTKGIKL